MIEPLEELIALLATLPAIGRKSATRLALHLIERPEAEVASLAQALVDARRRIGKCKRCFTYSETELCEICASPKRDHTIVCVVEKPSDVLAIEKSGRYRGTYHVLGGALSPLGGVTPDMLRIRELDERISAERPAEVIIALGGSAEAESTSHYLGRLLGKSGVRITRIAHGVPAGMDIEFVDQVTLGQALNERSDIRYGA